MSDDESELIRRPPKPRTGKGGELLLHELSRLVSQCKANSAWNLLKPPGEKSKEEKMQSDIRRHVDSLPWYSPVCTGGSVLHPLELRGKEEKKIKKSHSQCRQTNLKERLRKSSAAVEGSAHSKLKLCTALPCGAGWRGISAAIPSARLMTGSPLALSSPRCHSDFRHQGFLKQCENKGGGRGGGGREGVE